MQNITQDELTYNAEMIRRGEVMTKMLKRLSTIDLEDQAYGGKRTHTDQLTSALNTQMAVMDAIQETGAAVPPAMMVVAAAMTQHHADDGAPTNHLFVNPAKVTSKSSPSDLVEQVNELIVTALCDFLIVSGEAPGATFTRIDRELRNAGIELPGERMQTQKGMTSGATRLQNWRKKANSGRRPAQYLERYEMARHEVRRAAETISRDEPVVALMHEELIGCVICLVLSHVTSRT